MHRRSFVRAVLPLVLIATSCSINTRTRTQDAATARSEAKILERLYFGRTIPSGGTVSEADWIKFLDEAVTPRFPEGLTTWHAQGRWRDASGRIWQEESFILELIHGSEQQSETSVRQIMAEYRRRFRQDAVLRVRSRVEVEFDAGGIAVAFPGGNRYA